MLIVKHMELLRYLLHCLETKKRIKMISITVSHSMYIVKVNQRILWSLAAAPAVLPRASTSCLEYRLIRNRRKEHRVELLFYVLPRCGLHSDQGNPSRCCPVTIKLDDWDTCLVLQIYDTLNQSNYCILLANFCHTSTPTIKVPQEWEMHQNMRLAQWVQ